VVILYPTQVTAKIYDGIQRNDVEY